jgi:adenosylcobinamide kinase/adenosylcobinamide-phosphate guanylyltransferase
MLSLISFLIFFEAIAEMLFSNIQIIIMIYFITGGQRSGKSSYGQKVALKLSQNPIYLATSRIWDEDHKLRIKHHKSDRDDRWTTIEEKKYISNHDFTCRTVLMDCVTLWLTNFFYGQ